MKQPVNQALKEWVAICDTSEEYQQKINNLSRVMKTEEWVVVVEILWSIKNKMASDLLQSHRITMMDSGEKDIVQRVYHEVNEIIDFLTKPVNWISKKGRLTQVLSRVKKEREAQNGRGNNQSRTTT